MQLSPLNCILKDYAIGVLVIKSSRSTIKHGYNYIPQPDVCITDILEYLLKVCEKLHSTRIFQGFKMKTS